MRLLFLDEIRSDPFAPSHTRIILPAYNDAFVYAHTIAKQCPSTTIYHRIDEIDFIYSVYILTTGSTTIETQKYLGLSNIIIIIAVVPIDVVQTKRIVYIFRASREIINRKNYLNDCIRAHGAS